MKGREDLLSDNSDIETATKACDVLIRHLTPNDERTKDFCKSDVKFDFEANQESMKTLNHRFRCGDLTKE